MVKKQTPVTLENIDKLLNKRLDERFGKFEKKIDIKLDNKFNKFEKKIDIKLAIWKTDVDEQFEDVKQKISHLPNKDEYYEREDKTMGELKALRDEVAFTTDLYEKTNKRVNIIDKHLGITTSTVF